MNGPASQAKAGSRRGRVLHVIPTLSYSGAATQLRLLCAGLSDQFEMRVCALAGGPVVRELERAGTLVRILGRGWPIDPRAFWRLRREIADFQPHVLHTWLLGGAAYGLAAAGNCKTARCLATLRCEDRPVGALAKAARYLLKRRADLVVVDSAATRDAYALHRLPADRATIIPGGTPPYNPPAVSRQEVLRELQLPADVRLIVTVGRLSRRKRLKELVWAIEQLNVVHQSRIHLLLIGRGPQRWRLARYAGLVQITGNVHFLENCDDPSRFLQHADAVWMASSREGLSQSLLEALAAGVPIIAADIPANRQLLAHSESGLLVPLNVRSAFARTTHRLLTHPDLAARLRENGKRRAAEFSAQQMIERYADVYERLR